jgi:hypothetical protein
MKFSRLLSVLAVAAVLGAALTRAGAQDNVQAAPTCREQQPQDFLIRGNFAGRGHFTPAELRTRRETAARAIRYRTEHYGYFAPFGEREWNAHPPSFYARSTTFFGLHVRLNEQIIPAVACAEAEIRRACADHPYTPTHLSGLRDHNTYRGGEVSNHVYGVALDIDPTRNTCCGCVPPWNDAPACHREGATVYERMEMPECWVHAFEKYGFYWLGHDQLMDTMHFEFLGDTAAIR